ncbi:MAG TPA: aminotransferase class V-fold PLP-dependent enzyme [Acidobacteriota bacterium]|jgi:L-seryl-tRNA(Ser) seleniumtransferase
MTASRRTFLESIGLTSILSSTPFSKLFARNARAVESRHAGSTTPPQNLYQQLGIRPVINFRGTHTVLGASKQWPELHQPMAEAARYYVLLEELQDKVGERLAKLTGSEDAMVTTGAAGAITLGTCACLTGSDSDHIRRIPDLTGMKTEVIIQKVHRNGYDHAVRNTGVKIVEVESRDQLLNAAGQHTAMMYYLGGTSGDWAWETPVLLEECLAIGKKVGFPVMVDAANMLPPWDNILKLSALGTDLICISGGKHMRGPQCSGILAGRRDLIRAARLNSNPHSDSLGRPLKVGREEMIGVWLAAEKYAKLDFAQLERQSFEQAEYLTRELKRIPEIDVRYTPHDRTRRVYRVQVQWDEKTAGITADQCERQLLEGEPRIAILRNESQGILFTVFMNDPGDEKLAARRMKEIFGKKA